MKIQKISSHGTVAVKEVEIKVNTPITLICGSNRAGKTSLRDGIYQAFTGENPKVQLKKNYKHLINEAEGNSVGYTYVEFDGEKKAAITLPNGTHELTAPLHPALPYVLDPSLFPTSKADERRSFLFNLGNLRSDGVEVKGKLLERKCDADKVEMVMPFLKSSFDTAKQHADKKTTEARANWKAITGEAYGSLKAADWKAQKPVEVESQEEIEGRSKALLALSNEIEETAQKLGSYTAKLAGSKNKNAEIVRLRDTAEKATRIKEKLSLDKKDLAIWTVKVEDARRLSQGLKEGNVDCTCPSCGTMLTFNGEALVERTSVENNQHKEDAAKNLPEYTKSLEVLKNAVLNGERDLIESERASKALEALKKEDAEVITEEMITALKADIESLKVEKKEAQEIFDQKSKDRKLAAEADEKTKKAAGYHADVQAWDLISGSLAPDGIPSEMLSAALDPINARIAESVKMLSNVNPALPAKVFIGDDMTIFEDGNLYNLSSKATKFLIDSVIAEAISYVSGIKFVMIDEFDLLDIPSRKAYLTWLFSIADYGHIETVLLFGTLKQLPSGLPEDLIKCYWLEDGVIADQDLKAEAA
ncbi:hypothetical protein [Nitrosomonas sp.]|uniref:ATP-binding protein n=1 Tax=Nitrosomonas sp. TaxID=42353 RepID=UPI0025E83375|nr:hypothetical protein [Nitrosomonas sp.]MBY0483471.1 hypothetical protein [Nitrosomonas sp.]